MSDEDAREPGNEARREEESERKGRDQGGSRGPEREAEPLPVAKRRGGSRPRAQEPGERELREEPCDDPDPRHRAEEPDREEPAPDPSRATSPEDSPKGHGISRDPSDQEPGDLCGDEEETPPRVGGRSVLLAPCVRFHDARSLASGPFRAGSLAPRRSGRYR